MARTKASVGAKISSGKSSKSRCSVAPPTSSAVSAGSSEKSRGSGGGNPVCPRETPVWQKPITNFFINKGNSQCLQADGEVATSSNANPKSKPKRNIIHSDEESSPEKPKNKALDETIELEELSGENSHKIDEYYTKGTKGKGIGKKTKETNEDSNSATETEDIQDGEKGIENGEKEAENGEKEETIDKENIGVRKEKKERDSNDNVMSDKDSNIKSRNKREREDKLEEDGNISKKIKVK